MPLRSAKSHLRGRARISVLLADDHPIVRDGVRCLLERQTDIRVVAAVGDGSAAIRETDRLKPRVAIMDISMPGMNGIEATRVIASENPAVGVVMLSMHSSPIIVRRAIEAGARGYVAQDAVSEEGGRAARSV